MKKITLLFFLISSLSYCQTTEIEYNYLTKGYSETILKGLDLKQGYELQQVYLYSDSLYNFDFQIFVEKKTKKTKGILVCATSKLWSNKYYLCIPIDNKVLEQRYYDFLTTWDRDILKTYSFALSQMLSMSLSASEN